MRRFVVYSPGYAGEDGKAWEDAGFKLVEAKTGLEPGQRPDVVFWRQVREGSSPAWQKVRHLLPKLYVAVSSHEIPAPDSLSAIYDRQLIAAESMVFTIGIRIQGKVAAPDWEACRQDGLLLPEEQIKVVAGSIYRFLLEEVFRETAEWCGHMSSVVGPG